MLAKSLPAGTVHKLPEDMRKAITADKKILRMWEDITPLARSEWICWVESVKQQKTRDEHLKRVPEELMQGKRRPCCWVGCMHRPGAGRHGGNRERRRSERANRRGRRVPLGAYASISHALGDPRGRVS